MAWTLPDDAVLGIFGTRPGPGVVKLLLAAEFGPEFAAEVHSALLFDTLDAWGSERVLAPGGRRVLVYAPGDAGPRLDPLVPAAFALQPQAEGDLGDRMLSFFEGEFGEGAGRVVVLASDCPTLDPSIVLSAFLCLEGRDVVLGPSAGGGLYLVGARVAAAPIFERIAWGTPEVLSQVVDRLRDTGLSLAVLPPWYVVETPDSWRVLVGHVRALRRAGMDPGVPRVEVLLDRSG